MAFTDWYTFRLVDLDANVVRDRLEGVSGGVLDGNVATPIRWTGSINLEAPPDWDLWRTRIQPIYHRTGKPDEVVGTFHARPETWSIARNRHATSLALYDLTVHVQEDETSHVWTETAGAVVTDRVQAILDGIGLRTSVTPSAETLRRDLVFEETVTKLRVINDLLDAAGFFALHTNNLGQFQVRPYVPPQQRPAVYSFAQRLDAEHTATIVGEYPQTLPNRVIGKAPGDGDAPDLVSIAEDLQDFLETGVWRSRTYDGLEATSQGTLDLQTVRLLATARDTSTTVDRELLPRSLQINDVVADDTGSRFTVETIRRVLQPGQLMRVRLRNVKEGS